jgi:vacuolar-type H+-ATPase subunit F/Vma7
VIRLAYIGDSLTARAFALAGAQTFTPPAAEDEVWEVLLGARAQADLVVLNRAHAEVVRMRLEALLLADPAPPVVALPDFAADLPPDRVAVNLARRLLGVAI